MQDVHVEESMKTIDEDFEEDGEGESELKVDEACDLERRIPVMVPTRSCPARKWWQNTSSLIYHTGVGAPIAFGAKRKTLDHRRSGERRPSERSSNDF